MIDLLVKSAQNSGFDLSGGFDVDDLFWKKYKIHVDRYDQWLDRNGCDGLEYLIRGRDRRADPRLVFPELKSVFVVGRKYPLTSYSDDYSPRMASYLLDEAGSLDDDYHISFKNELNNIFLKLRETAHTLNWKVCVDTSAVLERSLAEFAGLGWIGKNSMLIHPKLGSSFFIGVVFLNRKVGVSAKSISSLCGNCQLCLVTCPTQAIDPSGVTCQKCISYWTLENKENEIALYVKNKMGPWLAGCDDCQTICPFNAKELKESPKHNPSELALESWIRLLGEGMGNYSANVKKTALSRVKAKQFDRNMAASLFQVLPKLSDKFGAEVFRLLPLLEEKNQGSWRSCIDLIHQLQNRTPNTRHCDLEAVGKRRVMKRSDSGKSTNA